MGGAECGCQLRMQAIDQMGNLCDTGGAKVEIVEPHAKTGREKEKAERDKGRVSNDDDKEIKRSVEDHRDGTYSLKWTSKMASVFMAAVRVDGHPVQVGRSSPPLGRCTKPRRATPAETYARRGRRSTVAAAIEL